MLSSEPYLPRAHSPSCQLNLNQLLCRWRRLALLLFVCMTSLDSNEDSNAAFGMLLMHMLISVYCYACYVDEDYYALPAMS